MSTRERAGETERRTGAFPCSARYRVLATLASGDAATVYVGSLLGPGGFERRVAIKRAHPHLLREPATRTMMADEARLAARIHHPNVVGLRDVEDLDGELLLIMDYVEGVSLSHLLDDGPLPARVAGRILLDAATGLAAVHALDEDREVPSAVIHRSVSPSNILVGIDGTARLADFGVPSRTLATPASRGRRLAYLAPEYVAGGVATPRIDVYAMGVVAWETLTSRRLLRASSDIGIAEPSRDAPIPPPSELAPGLDLHIDAVVLHALSPDPAARCSARELAASLEAALRRVDLLASRREVEEVVNQRCAESIRERRRRIRAAVPDAGAPSSGRFPIEPRACPPRAPRRSSAPTLSARQRVEPIPAPVKGWTVATLGAAGVILAGVLLRVGVTPPPSAMARPPARTLYADATLAASPPPAPPAVITETAAAPPSAEPASSPRRGSARRAAIVAPPGVAKPVDCEALAERGDDRREAGDLSGAEAFYREALAQNPRYLPARLAIADLEWDSGRTDPAREAYQRLIEQYAPELLPARVRTRESRGSDR